jgi:hypothetical protein
VYENGVAQGWGEVPMHGSIVCWCINAAGTYANESSRCIAEACPYAGRCVARFPELVEANGTRCTDGSEGVACVTCSRRWYRFRDECRPCPVGVPVSVVLLAIGAGVFLIYLGPKLSKLASPQAVALLRSLVMYLQASQGSAR